MNNVYREILSVIDTMIVSSQKFGYIKIMAINVLKIVVNSSNISQFIQKLKDSYSDNMMIKSFLSSFGDAESQFYTDLESYKNVYIVEHFLLFYHRLLGKKLFDIYSAGDWQQYKELNDSYINTFITNLENSQLYDELYLIVANKYEDYKCKMHQPDDNSSDEVFDSLGDNRTRILYHEYYPSISEDGSIEFSSDSSE